MNQEQNELKPKARGIYLLPNLFTLTALFAGFYAIVSAMQGRFDNAAIAIFIAAILDSLDGRIARVTHTETAFGAQFDSLSDMVSFGLAPSLVVFTWSLHNLGNAGWLGAFIFAVAVALRLARFNVTKTDKRYFKGLPSPAAAAVIAGLVWVGAGYKWSDYPFMNGLIAVFTVLIGLLMVSNIPYRSFKDFDTKGKVPFIVIVVLVLIYAIISIDPPEVLFGIFLLYVLTGPSAYLARFIRKRHLKKKNKSDSSQS